MVDSRIVYPDHHPYKDKLERRPLYGEEVLEATRVKLGALTQDDALTLLKVLLQHAELPVTDGNLGLCAEWVKHLDRDLIALKSMSPSQRNKQKKELRRYVMRGAKENEIGFMSRVNAPPPEPEYEGKTVFDGLMGHLQSLKKEDLFNKAGKLTLQQQSDVAELARRFEESIIFERPQGTSLHHFMDDLKAQVDFWAGGAQKSATIADFFKNEFQSFVIEHDWAKAFEGVKDFDGGEIKLPYAYTCFEFRVNGVRMIVFLGEGINGTIEGILANGVNKRWYINPMRIVFDGNRLYHPDYTTNDIDPTVTSYLNTLGQQIRAVCIMLDADVAVGERKSLAGEALQKKRQREGKAPLRDYHVVTLAKRLRGHHEGTGDSGIKKRLHWRRGHWRHFKTPGGEIRYYDEDGITVSKTWVKWHLAGNENLGFVEKHYRL